MMKSLIKPTVLLVLSSILIGCTQATPAPVPPKDTPVSPPTDTPAPPAETPETGSAEAYTVDINPADFADVIDNPYFPRIPGTRYVFEGETEEGLERIEIETLRETREVLGIEATVVRDSVYLDGDLIEDTFDWFAQDKDGNVWYLGEDVDNYENGELIDHAGSWQAGVNGALPGIIMYADPAAHIGETYRQEYYEGEAEDMAEVLSLSESESVPYGSFDNLLVTREWTPLDPDVVEHKYYAPGVGVILEVMVEGGSERVELVEIQTQN